METVDHYFLKDKIQITGVKQWPRESNTNEPTNRLIQNAIEEVKGTLKKGEPRISIEYLDMMLKDQFLGRKDKFEIVAKLLMNEDILNHLLDIFDAGNLPCCQPCCSLRNKP